MRRPNGLEVVNHNHEPILDSSPTPGGRGSTRAQHLLPPDRDAEFGESVTLSSRRHVNAGPRWNAALPARGATERVKAWPRFRGSLTAWAIAAWLTGSAVTSPLLAAPSPTCYRLIRGSTATTSTVGADGTTNIQSYVLTGSFVSYRVLSPLDWQNWQLDSVRLTATPTNGASILLHGSGRYTIGSRTAVTQQLTFNLDDGDQPLTLDSGQQPGGNSGPRLNLILTGTEPAGTGQPTWSVHLLAVPVLKSWHYQLVEGSVLLDQCLLCGLAPIPQPLHGSFDLALEDNNPLGSDYHLFNVHFQVGSGDQTRYTVTGEGDLNVGGEVAIQQTLVLDVDVQTPGGVRTTFFTNSVEPVRRLWPMLSADLTQTNGTPSSTLSLKLFAAPFRELWFLTSHGLTSGNLAGTNSYIDQGNILADTGRIVKTKAALLQGLNLKTPLSQVQLDALDVRAGYRFSLAENVTNSAVGPIQEGDVLTPTGFLFRNQQLLAPFGLMPPVPDVGVDAFQMLDYNESGPTEVVFSIRQDVYSEQLGRQLGHGDLLSIQYPANGSPGVVRETNQQLLSRFHPPDPKHDYGLDAVYVWPSGEIWFSTEEGFTDADLGPISDGDLLSDQGYVVFRNLDLVNAFAPMEDIANFGLVGLDVVTDAGYATQGATQGLPTLNATTGDVTLGWKVSPSAGQEFQVERADAAGEAFQPISPIIAEQSWVDPGALFAHPNALYRIRQW